MDEHADRAKVREREQALRERASRVALGHPSWTGVLDDERFSFYVESVTEEEVGIRTEVQALEDGAPTEASCVRCTWADLKDLRRGVEEALMEAYENVMADAKAMLEVQYRNEQRRR